MYSRCKYIFWASNKYLEKKNHGHHGHRPGLARPFQVEGPVLRAFDRHVMVGFYKGIITMAARFRLVLSELIYP